MEVPKEQKMSGRVCFVTVGATSSFEGLVEAVLEQKFLKALASLGYSELRVQYGREGQSAMLKALGMDEDNVEGEEFGLSHGISISGFPLRPSITEDMMQAKAQPDNEGVIISHAGTGSILEAMRIEAPLIVVPNSALLHNHQEELAEELAHQGYVVHGRLDNLVDALHQSDSLRKKRKSWPPREAHLDPSGKGLSGVLDEELGFVD